MATKIERDLFAKRTLKVNEDSVPCIVKNAVLDRNDLAGAKRDNNFVLIENAPFGVAKRISIYTDMNVIAGRNTYFIRSGDMDGLEFAYTKYATEVPNDNHNEIVVEEKYKITDSIAIKETHEIIDHKDNFIHEDDIKPVDNYVHEEDIKPVDNFIHEENITPADDIVNTETEEDTAPTVNDIRTNNSNYVPTMMDRNKHYNNNHNKNKKHH